MAITPVTPSAGLTSVVLVGGNAVIVANGGINGGFITNPASAVDQGLSEPEMLYVDSVGSAGLEGNGTTFALAPGQSYPMIPGQTTQTSVNAASNGHKFSVVIY